MTRLATTPILNQTALAEVVTALDQARTTIDNERLSMARALRERNPMSRMFVGFIREYRYSAGRKGEMPSHRFYLECGGGVWLFANVPSSQFEKVMKDMTFDFTSESLNGQMLLCQGQADINAVVPIEFVEPLDPPITDRFGNPLYKNCPVVCDSGTTQRTGVLSGYRNNLFLVNIDDADSNEVPFTTENVARSF